MKLPRHKLRSMKFGQEPERNQIYFQASCPNQINVGVVVIIALGALARFIVSSNPKCYQTYATC